MSGCWLRFEPASCPTFRLTWSRMGYRIVQRAVRIDDGTTRVDSVLSPDGRVLRRTVSSPPGVTVAVATVPASRLDWLGTQRRFVDHPGLDITRMGVRAYDPHLGRFLSQDPIAGGSANDYDYVNGDPINNLDLAGTWCIGRRCLRARAFRRKAYQALRGAAVIPYLAYYTGLRGNQIAAKIGFSAGHPIRQIGWGMQIAGIEGDIALDWVKNQTCCRESLVDERKWGSPNPFHAPDAHPGSRDSSEIWLPGLGRAHSGWTGLRLDFAW